MKTIQEFYKELAEDNELKEEFVEAANAGGLEDFLGEHGCDATLEEIGEFFKEMAAEDESLSFDELEQAAGGGFIEAAGNVFASLTAVMCVVASISNSENELCKITETGDGPGIGVVKL